MKAEEKIAEERRGEKTRKEGKNEEYSRVE